MKYKTLIKKIVICKQKIYFRNFNNYAKFEKIYKKLIYKKYKKFLKY